MCTAITLTSPSGTVRLGRNLDFGMETEPHLISIAAGAQWNEHASGRAVTSEHAILCVGQFGTGYPVLLDGVNSAGLAGGVLFFPGYAAFPTPDKAEGEPCDALDLIRLLLGSCATVDEVRSELARTVAVGVPNNVTHQVAPLHWIFSDRSGDCVVVEVTEDGQKVHDNPVRVLTNSPDFPWHLTNLRNYLGARAEQPAPVKWSEATLAPFGAGAGCSMLPGGYTPPERFVRAAFMAANVEVPDDEAGAVAAMLHALEAESVPTGAATDGQGPGDHTQYSSIMNAETGDYHFRTYENPMVFSARMADLLPGGKNPDGSDVIDLGSIRRPFESAAFVA